MKDFDIYPLRLIFKLLTDKRLDCKLTNIEVSEILYYVKTVKNNKQYDDIVNRIIKFRNIM